MNKPAISREQYIQILNQYGLHKYDAKRLTCKLTIVCKNLDELVLSQLLGIERNWTREKCKSLKPLNIYVYMETYARYLPDLNPDIEIPVFPIYVSFSANVFTREIILGRSEPPKRRIIEFSKFFTLKPEFRGHNLKKFGI